MQTKTQNVSVISLPEPVYYLKLDQQNYCDVKTNQEVGMHVQAKGFTITWVDL